MKKIVSTLSVLLLLSGISSCNYKGAPWSGIEGQGPVVERKLALDSMKGISIPGSAKVFLTQGAQQEVRIEGQENIIDNLNLAVNGEIWRIEGKRPVRRGERLIIHITMENLRMVRISGSGDVYTENPFKNSKDIELRILGSGTINLDLDADDITGQISGSGNIILKGSADKLNVGISGSGNFKGQELKAHSADVRVSGSGDMDLWIDERLDARISGSGNVWYQGEPEVNSHVSGSGHVRSR